MKKLLSLLPGIFLFSIIIAILGCNSNPVKKDIQTPEAAATSSTASIDGAWELVWENVGDKPRTDGKVSQFKMFHDGFFSLIMQDSAGNWSLAAGGPCSLEGNTYKETFRYCSFPDFVGATDWQECELKGDTLYFKGFTKAIFANGEDKTTSFPKFEEKRVRAKR
jgi:hypothetical protein